MFVLHKRPACAYGKLCLSGSSARLGKVCGIVCSYALFCVWACNNIAVSTFFFL